ncbi:MAG TPA: oligosaccharide flippase family protein [Candidatus Syntrophosphaera sp.]|jgi:O-antigen/teichoic acid export membrane protein|nr:oligosaccharide flippase family protein [Candidatus Syntrophosphaera sp.]
MTQDRSKQAGMLTSVEFIRFGCKALVGVILARILLPAELGSYRQLFLIYTTFSTLMLLGIPQSVLYFLPKFRHSETKAEFITRTVNLVSWLAFLFAAGIFLLRGLIARVFHNPELDTLLVIYAIYPLFMFITQIYSSVTLGLQQPVKTATFTLFTVATDLLFILGAALLTKDLSRIVLGVMISAFMQWAFAQWQLSRYRIKASFDPNYYRDVFNYSLPLGLSSIIGMLSIQLDKLVVSGFFTPAQYAVFSIGAMELPFISILNNSVNAILLPHISGDTAQMEQIYRAAVRKNALIIFPFSMLAFIFAKPLITLLYTNTYAASVPYFQVYLLVLPLKVATYGIIFMAMQKTRYIMVNSLLTLGLNLVLNLILVKAIGMMGAALATVIVTWLSVAIYMFWIKNHLKLRLNDLFPWKAIMRTALATVVAGALSMAVFFAFGQDWIWQFAALAVFAAAFILVGRGLNAILPYDVAYVKTLFRQARTRLGKAS